MTPTQIELLEKSKDPDVKELLKEYNIITSSPYYKAYVTLYKQMDDWCDQLTIKEDGYDEAGKPKFAGKIDLFSDKDSKEFDRAYKFWAGYTELSNTLENIWNKMTPKEQEDSQKEKKHKNLTGIAV